MQVLDMLYCSACQWCLCSARAHWPVLAGWDNPHNLHVLCQMQGATTEEHK